MIHKELSKYLAEHGMTLTLRPDGHGQIQSGRSHVTSRIIHFDTLNELTALVRSCEMEKLKQDLEEARNHVKNLEARHMKLCYSDPVPQPDLEDI